MVRPVGLPKSGGRKVGSLNKATIARHPDVGSGILPLEYMLSVMRDENNERAMRNDMAKAAAPYIHPRLSTTEIGNKGGDPLKVELAYYTIAK